MKIRPFLMAILACTALSSPLAMAHSGAHDDDEKEMPKTCEQLADTKRYLNDLAYPEIKALKEQCDASAAKKPAATPSPATSRSSDGKN